MGLNFLLEVYIDHCFIQLFYVASVEIKLNSFLSDLLMCPL